MQDRRLLWLLLVIPVIVSLAGVWILDHTKAHKPIFSMTNMVGPTTRSLLAGDGLIIIPRHGLHGSPSGSMRRGCRCGSALVALGMRLLGDHYLRVACFKTLLFLLLIELCIYLVWRHLAARQV